MSTRISTAVRVDTSAGKAVSPVCYGWHYEEIGMIGDGGLYAEMIRNRNFAEAGLAPGMTVKNGMYENIPRPEARHKAPEYLPELNCWSVFNTDGIDIRRVTIDEKERNFEMEIRTRQLPQSGLFGVANEGFFGVCVRAGMSYRVDLVLNCDAGGFLSVCVADGQTPLTEMHTVHYDAGKSRHRFVIGAERSADNGVFLIVPGQVGIMRVSFVSLFPCDTWDGGKSVFRSDIMQNMLDFKPEFLRFPGGCIVHGVNVDTMYHWKETLADISERKSTWSKWQPHYMSNGIGYHEFYELCEYLGADAMYVAPSGLVCTSWVFQKGDSTDFTHPEVDVNDYIQDCLDAIEYAIGPVDSVWGRKRAERGHPAPFPLRYVSVGNEDFGPRYYKHYHAFYTAIKERYPQLKIIANSIIGNRRNSVWDNKRVHLSEFVDPSTVEIFDEHYYETGDWFFENFDRFDEYSRTGPDLMCLELGIESNQPSDILYESLFLMMMEKNGELHPVFAGRPLMRNWDYVNGELNPYYYHTNCHSWKTIHYYAKKLFRDNRCDRVFPTTCMRADGKQILDEKTVFAICGEDSHTGDLILKLVNLDAAPQHVPVDAGISSAVCTVSTLVNTPELPRTPEASECFGPVVRRVVVDFSTPFELPGKSVTVIRIHKAQ